jgi:predicted DNA-binding protein YlxM (UPF0122 family)
MTLDEIQKCISELKDFQKSLEEFESQLQRRWRLKQYTGNEWMMGPHEQTPLSKLGPGIIETLSLTRENIAKHIDRVTAILDRYELPTVWKVYPPAAIGGVIQTYNTFEAFINLEIDKDARPTYLQVSDVV